MSDTEPLYCSQGGIPYNKAHLDARDAKIKELRAEIKRLRALLARYQVANYAPEDSDLYEETRRALEGK